jgi:hypothetical protein
LPCSSDRRQRNNKLEEIPMRRPSAETDARELKIIAEDSRGFHIFLLTDVCLVKRRSGIGLCLDSA